MLIYCHTTLQFERMYYMDLSATLYHGYMGRKRAALSTPENPVPCTRAFVTLARQEQCFLFSFFPCYTQLGQMHVDASQRVNY